LLSTNHLPVGILPPWNSINWFNSVVAITPAAPRWRSSAWTPFEPNHHFTLCCQHIASPLESSLLAMVSTGSIV